MASSDVEICNRALDALGVEIITSFGDGTRASGLCNRYFSQVRDDVLRSHPWNCAIKRETLAASVTAPTWGFDYAYPLPSDCLRVVTVEGEDVDGGAWQVEAGSIVTDLSAPLYIRYVHRVTATGLLDPMLVSVIAARLAMELAQPLTGSPPIRQAMQKEYLERLRAARSADGQEGTALILGANDFVLSRL